ncbi:hypothetical protein E4U16_008116 [Claviceps sp. LM84 group G4]|nr:hypothetical protein E4U16_008116 [Claviceps sp. LM84 group G4]
MATPFKLPVISTPGSFDGSSDAMRWLTKLQWSFQAVNEGRDPDPNTFIKAMNMALEGQAATYVDSSEVLRSIVSRAAGGGDDWELERGSHSGCKRRRHALTRRTQILKAIDKMVNIVFFERRAQWMIER